MKIIYRIAKNELASLFYSPVAWVVLLIFWIQSGWLFFNLMEFTEKNQQLGMQYSGLTSSIFTSDFSGLFAKMQENLYLYIPLLTMGLISRERSSGSIKLLFSSPVKIKHIILGKYLAITTYCLALILVLAVYVGIGFFSIEALDVKFLLSGLLGLFLLIATYAAIGLFMSCLTSYQVIVAICTLVVLGFLNMVGKLWQNIDILRDITYFLSISGRSDQMISGLIISRDVIYFVLVSSLFVGLSMMKLQFERAIKSHWIKAGLYASLFLSIIFIGYITSLPKLTGYYDMSATKEKTLTPNSQDIVKQLNQPLKITTYVNLLDEIFYYGIPQYQKNDIAYFDKYRRFLPDMEMEYVFYYDQSKNQRLYAQNPGLSDKELVALVQKSRDLNFKNLLTPEEIHQNIDLSGEENRFVRQLEYNGKTTFLRMYDDMIRYPSEKETSAAIKRLIQPSPEIYFLSNNGERSILKMGDKEYKTATTAITFRNTLINQGFTVNTIQSDSLSHISQDATLVIADPLSPYSASQMENIRAFFEKGGNMLVLTEKETQNNVQSIFDWLNISTSGITLIQNSKDYAPDFVLAQLSDESLQLDSTLSAAMRYPVSISGGIDLKYNGPANDFEVFPVLSAKINKNAKQQDSCHIALALKRNIQNHEQRIMVMGDADFMSNSELIRRNVQTSNFNFMTGVFKWFSYGEFPIDTTRPKTNDDKVLVDTDQLLAIKTICLFGISTLLLLVGAFLLIKRNKR